MELDERVMDKILADVKEIVAEADGTLRFIFYSPYSEETYEGDKIEELENEIERLRSINVSKNATIKMLEEKLAGGRND
jgi:hypothetical protein